MCAVAAFVGVVGVGVAVGAVAVAVAVVGVGVVDVVGCCWMRWGNKSKMKETRFS